MADKMDRRGFLRKGGAIAAGAVSFPYIVSSGVLCKAGTTAPSDRIVMGCIGVGWQGTENLKNFLNERMAQVAAVCDIDKEHLEEARTLVNRRYGNRDCAVYHDFRELLAREDIDAVSLGLPDHWHSIPAIEAARAGKDIFGEKPLSHSVVEGRAMCDAVAKYGRIWQTGSWQRSLENFRHGCEIVRNGMIGKVHTVEVGLPSGHSDFAQTKGQETPGPAPEALDYDRWLGPAPWAPYCPARVHKNWRWVLDYGGGQLMDWVGHHVDIAHWGLGFDMTGPVEIEGTGEYPRDGLWNTATRYKVHTKYSNGIAMIIAGGYGEIEDGTKWIGDAGWVWVARGNQIKAEPRSLLQERIGASGIHLYNSPGHWRNFLECIKSRQETIAPCETAHRSATPGHLGQIAMLLGRKLRFNPQTEEIIDDAAATEMLGNSMRSPWHI